MRVVFVSALSALLLALAPPLGSAADTVTILDSLGTATPASTFSVFGTGFQPLTLSDFRGPQFILSGRTTISEIGAFVNPCIAMSAGVPLCPNPGHPVVVDIRRSVGGVPDATASLGRFALTDDGQFFVVSYESVAPNITLDAGSYFALFAPQDDALAGLLCCSTDYLAGLTLLGQLDPTTNTSWASMQYASVRILGIPAGPEELLLALLEFVDSGNLGPGTSLHDKILETQGLLTAGDTEAACGSLRGILEGIRAQRGKSLSPSAADELVSRVEEVRRAIGC